MKAPAHAHTSDKQDRANARAITLPSIPTSMSDSKRVGVLADIGGALKTGGASTLNVIDRSAAYSQNDVTQRINDLITAANGLGAVPAMKTYVSVDYNSFVSVIKSVAAGIGTIP
jgi:hypothetical protein